MLQDNKEIGSEYWDNRLYYNKIFLLSGRTALEYIIRDIIKDRHIESVFLPSYCCHTMIEPFIRHHINIKFYNVYYSAGHGLSIEMPDVTENDIFYCIKYFGFTHLYGVDLDAIQKKNCIVIEDKTHSWLNEESSVFADYSYISYRKWTGFDGIATAQKNRGSFSEKPNQTNHEYISLRNRAFSLKAAYIDGKNDNKQEFLRLFDEAETLLENDYVGYAPTYETLAALQCIDTKSIKAKRRANANILLIELSKVEKLQLVYPNMDECDVPLFVPILVDDKRDDLKKFLISNAIYCPNHWPLSGYHEGISERAKTLYQQELSVVCDQRYGAEEMYRIAKTIKQFYEA